MTEWLLLISAFVLICSLDHVVKLPLFLLAMNVVQAKGCRKLQKIFMYVTHITVILFRGVIRMVTENGLDGLKIVTTTMTLNLYMMRFFMIGKKWLIAWQENKAVVI